MSLSLEQDAVATHVAHEIGPVHGIIALGKPRPEALPLALLHVPATEHKPFQVLVSAGMSAYRMTIPEDVEDDPADRIELALALPPDWNVQSSDPNDVWPLRLLARLARFPSEAEEWLCEGHTIPNGNPPHPFSPNTQLSCALIAPPLTLPPEAQAFRAPHGDLRILAVVPLYDREVEFKVNEGSQALFERLDEYEITEIIDPERRAVAGGTLFDLLDGRPT